MKKITISRIEPTNPVLLSYVDRIKSWDKEKIIKIVKNEHVVPFYALYYGIKFFGAGTIEFDRENSKAKVAVVSACNDTYNMIQSETENIFQEIIASEFDTTNVEFSYTKKRG